MPRANGVRIQAMVNDGRIRSSLIVAFSHQQCTESTSYKSHVLLIQEFWIYFSIIVRNFYPCSTPNISGLAVSYASTRCKVLLQTCDLYLLLLLQRLLSSRDYRFLLPQSLRYGNQFGPAWCKNGLDQTHFNWPHYWLDLQTMHCNGTINRGWRYKISGSFKSLTGDWNARLKQDWSLQFRTWHVY